MAHIVNDLILDPEPGRTWRVVFPFVVDTDTAGRLVVPAGFVCDLNSMPRFLWFASTPADYPEAGVVHDWGYRGHLSQATADAVYYELLRALGMGAIRAHGRYRALRLFGRFAYKG
jgi:hypothetical protein